MPSGGFVPFSNLLYPPRSIGGMAQASCRIRDELDDAFDAAAAEAGLFRSDLFRRALIRYVEQNPHEFEAFDSGIPSPVAQPPNDVSGERPADPNFESSEGR